MKLLIGWSLILALFAVPIVLYKAVYFKRVSCIIVDFANGGLTYVGSVRPTKRALSDIFNGAPYNFVPLGNGFFALFTCSDEESSSCVCYNGVRFSSPVYIFQKNRFGRFKSVDCSKRSVFEILKKFNCGV